MKTVRAGKCTDIKGGFFIMNCQPDTAGYWVAVDRFSVENLIFFR
jgi:hypothetical protein